VAVRADALGGQQHDARHAGRLDHVDDVLEVAAGKEVGGGEEEDGLRAVEGGLQGFGFGQVGLMAFAATRDGYDVFAGGDQGLDEWAAYVAGCSGDHDHEEDATGLGILGT
jgi:hypothetical protein